MDLKRSGSKKQNQKDLDDVLGDLLVEDSDFGLPKKEINRRPSKDRNKPSSRDDDFYSALASAAGQPDESDISEADVNQVANTLADLDDLDADLFGGKYNKKKSGPSTPRQRTPRTPRAVSPPGKGGLARSSTPTSPPGTATGDRGRHTDRVNTPPQSIPKPSTAPGNIADLTRGSESLKPGEIKSDRPRTVPKAKPKFGEFDEDDPLAGLLSDEDEDLDEAKTITARSRAKGGNLGEDHTDSPKITSPRGAAVPHGVRERDPLSPRRQRLMDRPPTRSGDNNGVVDKPLDKLFEPAPDSPRRSSTAPDEGKVKKKDDVIFSDTEDDLLTGLEDNAPAKPQPATKAPEEATKPAKSVLDSLLGKDTVSKHLERPASASGKEFVLDKKYQKPQEEKDEEFLFGGYMPSMAGSTTGSRPTSRRSVRFEESDDIFATPPSRGEGSMKMEKTSTPASKDLDWLELAANGESGKKDATPSLPKTPESKKSGSSESDWLGLKDDKEETFDWLHSETVKPRSAEKTRNRSTPTQVEKTAVPTEQKTHTQPPKSLFEDDSYAFLHDGPSKSVSTPNKAATPKPPAPDSSDWLGLGKDPPLSGAAVSPVAGVQSKGRRASFATDPSPIFTDQIKQKDSHVNAPPVSVDQLMGVTGPIRGHTDPFVSSTPLPSAGPDSQHQAILQQQITHAQDQLRQQRAEQLRMQQEQEQLVLQQQQSQLEGMLSQLQQQYQANQMAKASIPTMGSITSHNLLSSATHKSIRLDPNYARMDLETKVRKLEIELECVESRCDSNQRRYQEELTAVELSYQNRMKVLEDSRKKMEDGWREETESQVAKHLSRVRQLEEERGRMERRVEQCERDRLEEVERVREAQRKMTAELKREYDESVERVRAVKNQEIDNIANSHSAAKSLQAVMQQISSNAKDLGELQCKVDTWNKMGLDEREIFVRTKDEQLRMLQERLDRQQEENGLERVRLQDLISRLERQLADQGRTLDEEKWRLKQEQGKLQSAQGSLEEERRVWLDQQARELSALDKAKDALLQEQKQILAQLYEERRSMAEDRSQLKAAQRALQESEQHHAVKYLKADAEYEVTMKSVAEERQRSETRQRELDKAEEHVRSQLASIESDRSKLQHEQSRVAQLALEVKQRSQELNAMAASASQTEEEGRKSLESAQRLEADHNHRASQIQAQLQSLRTKEKEIAEERVVLAREKKEVEQLRRSMLCVNCRTPVRDVGLNPQTHLVNGYVAQGSPSTPHRPNTGLKTPSGVVVTSPLPTDVLTLRNGLPVSANAVGAISASIEADKSVRMWKIQAEKDKEYLMSESMFLETLKQSPYNSSRLTS